jgi:hypothetical protein
METDTISEAYFFLETSDDGQSQKACFFQVQYTIIRTF